MKLMGLEGFANMGAGYLGFTLDDFVKYFGADRLASVSRELTKIYEETKNGTLAQVLKYFTNNIVKGEIVIIVSGKTYSQKAQQQNEPTEETDG